ncbi:MAG: CDP-glycerol glycerophosphotransferase family protein [Prevotella sp.]|nr:CDP-glycerol glycerophosphotransferase family protein [Prevotella sp.]
MRFSTILSKSVSHFSAHLNFIFARIAVGMKKPERNKYFCMSLLGESYGDNIKPLSDYLAENEERAQIVWAFNKHFTGLSSCPHKAVKLYTFSYYYHMLTSKFILSNARLNQRMMHKRKGQVYLQTWHGTALKRLGTDIKRQRSPWEQMYNPGVFEFDVGNTDIMISGSRFMTNIFREKFQYKGMIAETGTPRTDIFFHYNPMIKTKVCQAFGLEEGKQLILYAPTYRADKQYTFYDIDLKKVKDTWERKTGRSCDIMVRLHPKLRPNKQAFEQVFGNNITDASAYSDMQELLYATDLFVTDYSSTMFDFMYTGRPVLLYTPDRESYNRGFYFQLQELPFMVINNNNEIEHQLNAFDANSYATRIELFKRKIGSVESGNATEQVIRLLQTYNECN